MEVLGSRPQICSLARHCHCRPPPPGPQMRSRRRGGSANQASLKSLWWSTLRCSGGNLPSQSGVRQVIRRQRVASDHRNVLPSTSVVLLPANVHARLGSVAMGLGSTGLYVGPKRFERWNGGLRSFFEHSGQPMVPEGASPGYTVIFARSLTYLPCVEKSVR